MAYMERRIYGPNNRKLREEILKEHYNPVDIGHLGQHRILELLKRMYWWMCRDVLNVNKTKFSTNEKQKNYIHWRFQRDHGKKLAST